MTSSHESCFPCISISYVPPLKLSLLSNQHEHLNIRNIFQRSQRSPTLSSSYPSGYQPTDLECLPHPRMHEVVQPLNKITNHSLDTLPPELLNNVASYLPTARDNASLGSTSRRLSVFMQKEGWRTFNSQQFPSICPIPPPSQRNAARSLVTLSTAWDRRSFVARYIEPRSNITVYPGAQSVGKWQRSQTQTLGFAPHINVKEYIGTNWRDREEVLAYTAGTEICVRRSTRTKTKKEHVEWMLYKAPGAKEGPDDLSTLRLLDEDATLPSQDRSIRAVTGSARGDLSLVTFPKTRHLNQQPGHNSVPNVRVQHFSTNNQPVRCSALLPRIGETDALLLVGLDWAELAMYKIGEAHQESNAVSRVGLAKKLADSNDDRPPRLWSISLLDDRNVIAGLGVGDMPVRVYPITPSGLDATPIRTFSLNDDYLDATLSTDRPAVKSAVYSVVPLPHATSATSSQANHLFLSVAYDGVVRLHDMRSPRATEQRFSDPTDSSAIYSLLPRGREMFIAGSSRYSLLKIFDLRMGAKAYSWLDASHSTNKAVEQPGLDTCSQDKTSVDWNLFAKPPRPHKAVRNNNNRQTARNNNDSSVYSLAASSAHSPFLYVGLENNVMEISFSDFADGRPDPSFFATSPGAYRQTTRRWWDKNEFVNLAMYDQGREMKLYVQRDLDVERQRGEERGRKDGQKVNTPLVDSRWISNARK